MPPVQKTLGPKADALCDSSDVLFNDASDRLISIEEHVCEIFGREGAEVHSRHCPLHKSPNVLA